MTLAGNGNTDLPEGWCSTLLRDLVQPSKNKVEPKNCPDSPYLSLEHIESGTGQLVGRGIGSDVGSTKAVFRSGDVLYGKLRPYLNKVSVPDFDGICSTDILVFEKSPVIESQLLRHFLSQPEVVEYAHHHSAGVQLPRVSFASLGSLLVPLAPLAEQRRIVAKVESLLAPVQAVRERLTRVPKRLKRFRQAILAAACDGRLTADWREQLPNIETTIDLIARLGKERRERYVELCNVARETKRSKPQAFDNLEPNLRSDLDLHELPPEWQWVDVRFLMAVDELFCYGVVQPGTNDPGGNLLVRAGDLKDGSVDVSGLRRIPAEVDAEYKRSRLKGGELLVTVVGAGIGTVSITPDACAGFNIARAVAKLPIRDVDAKYVFRWLSSERAGAWMFGDSREVARPTLNLEQLKTIPVPLPPLAEQLEIVRRVDALFKLADAIERHVAAATARADKLPQAILGKAFRGELVPTEADLARTEGRDYEPATALLERIRAAGSGNISQSRGKARQRSTIP